MGDKVLRMVIDLRSQSDNAVLRGKQNATSLMNGLLLYYNPEQWNNRAEMIKEESRNPLEKADMARIALSSMQSDDVQCIRSRDLGI